MEACCYPFKIRRSSRNNIEKIDGDFERVKIYTYKELKNATNNFSSENKIGEGGFGSVYKGRLKDGTMAAIKVLSAQSRQGVREFLTEITVISDIIHENLVKLLGCCFEGNQRILLYDYLENNSLSQTLLGANYSGLHFSWEARRKICIGIARGLAYLHEELQPPILHRDIKASNILLDANLNPKISDFGLAKLLPANKTHVSTRVAGTIGYLAPEYAIRGQVTKKSDIYSFGVLLTEIVSGRCNTNTRLPVEHRFLLERAWILHELKELMDLIDTSLSGECDEEEACRFLKVGLLCTQDSMKSRPSMSVVVKMLMGEKDVDLLKISRPSLMSDFMEGRKQHSTDEITTNNTVFSYSPRTSSVETSQPSFPFTAISERE